MVNLEVMDAVQDKAIDQVTYGRPYRIRAHFSRPDGEFKSVKHPLYIVVSPNPIHPYT